MSATLETRVEALEHEVTGIKAMLEGRRPVKDWRVTFGMSRDDPAFDELVRLGREIREHQQKGNSADGWHRFLESTIHIGKSPPTSDCSGGLNSLPHGRCYLGPSKPPTFSSICDAGESASGPWI